MPFVGYYIQKGGILASTTILTAKTLAERVSRSFSRVKIKKASVKVPKLKAGKEKIKPSKPKKDDRFPVSSIINILIKTAVEKAKRDKKEKSATEEDKSYIILKDDKTLNINGGYGTISKGYGTAPHASYVDYGKLVSYLGKLKSQTPYENMAEHLGTLNKATESGSFVLADRDSMDKIGRYERYNKNPLMDMPAIALSLVPVAGLSSGEWEEIKMLMKLDPVIYNLKTRIS